MAKLPTEARMTARISDDDHRRQQCVGKVRFATRVDAQATLQKQQRRHSGGDRRFSVYSCRHCKGYHTGQSLSPKPMRTRLKRPLREYDEGDDF